MGLLNMAGIKQCGRSLLAFIVLILASGAHAGSLTGSASYQSAPGTIDLTTEGTDDWIHWGLSSAVDVNRKTSGGSQISDLSMIGGATLFRFSGNPANWSTHSWTDGTPTASESGFPGGVYIFQTAGGYEFTAPADSTARTLKVYVGGSSATSEVQVSLSDSSASPLTLTLPSTSSGDHWIVTLDYQADTPGSTILVRQVHTAGTPIIGIQAASLISIGNQPPVLTPPGNKVVTVGNNLNFDVNASDPDGPAPLVMTLENSTPTLPGAATYTDNGSGNATFDWTPQAGDEGSYQVTFRAREDNGTGEFDEETITITVQAAGGAFVSGAAVYQTTPGTVDFTTEGTADWIHWGLTTASSVNRKATGGTQISDLTLLGGATRNRFGGNPANWSNIAWSDGSPTGSEAGFPGGIYSATTNGGYEFTVPASGSARTLKVYLGGSNATSQIEAILSDSSAGPWVTTLPATSGADHWIVTIDFEATTPGATLTLRQTHTGDTNIIGIQGATLVAVGNVPPTLDPIGNKSGSVGNNLNFGVTASDPDGPGPLAMTISSSTPALPAGAVYTDHGDGTATFDWTPASGDEDSYSVTFRAQEAGGGSFDEETITINIAANQPPSQAAIGNKSVAADTNLNFTVTATDADGPAPLTMSISNSTPALPAAATYTENSSGNSTFNWTPTAADIGSYDVTFRSEDGGGLFDDETITITVTSGGGGGGAMSGSAAYQSTPGVINLTTEGETDWIHWGLTAASDVNRKATGGNLFSNLSPVGGATLFRFGGNSANWSTHTWSDGTPTSSESGFPGGLYTVQNNGGYEFTVPADTQERTLKVYLGGSSSISEVTATLSDGSAGPYVTTIAETSSADHYVITITYQAASAGQTLTVRQVHTGGTTNIIGIQAATLSTPFALPFTDDFSDGNADGWTIIDETPDASAWSVVAGQYYQTARVQSVFAIEDSYHLGSFAYLAAGTDLTDYEFSVTAEYLATGLQDSIGVVFRYQDPLNYYRLLINARYGFTRLEKQVAGVFAPLATNARGYREGEVQTILIRVVGNNIVVAINGDETFAVTDSALSSGTVGLFTQEHTRFDNVSIIDPNTLADVTLSAPLAHLAQGGNQIIATANARNVPVGGYVEFQVDGAGSQTDATAPYSATFNGVAAGNRTVTAILRDSADVELDRDTNVVFGVSGDYLVSLGDSITDGIGDFYRSDNESSLDRVWSAQGYQAALTDLLDSSRATQTNIVFNEGIGGDTTADTANTRLDSIILRHPNMNTALVLLGTNDAGASVPSGLGCSGAACNGTFKGNTQIIIDKLRFSDYPTNSVPSGVTVYIAEVPPDFSDANPWTSITNDRIRDYNTVVRTELVDAQIGPDFFDYFMPSASVNFESMFLDALHPNSLGHHVKSVLWHNVLETPIALPFVLDALASSVTTEPKQNLIEVGDVYYLDESHTITSIPAALNDGRWVMTDNADFTDTSTDFITFDVDRASRIYVAVDGSTTTLPGWMISDGYVSHGTTITSTKPEAPSYDVYYLDVGVGSVSIGGASQGGAAGMNANLLVIVVED